MLKRELKINFKGLIIWLSIIMFMFLIAFIIYPTIMSNIDSKAIGDFIKIMPKEVLKMFNMDLSSIDTAFGWMKTEGYMYLVLIIGLYSAILGSNILLKEESEKTIEFLYSKPISRNKIIFSKITCGFIYIISMVLVMTIFNYIGLSLSCTFDKKVFFLLSLAPILTCLPLFLISMLISTLFNKTKKTIGISIGIVFMSYFLQLLSSLSDSAKFIKYFSIFTLSDGRSIIQNSSISYLNIIISVGICIICFIGILKIYNNKELV